MNKLQDICLTFMGIWKYHMFLKKSQSFSSDQIAAIQSQWLTDLLTHAHKNIPWYSKLFRQYGIDVYSANPLEELKKFQF